MVNFEGSTVAIDGQKYVAAVRAIWLMQAEKELKIGGSGRQGDGYQVERLEEAYKHEAQQLGLMIIREVEAALK